MMAARVVGANPIIGVDIKPKRLQLPMELGGTHVIDNRHDDIISRVADITGSGVDYVLEITGSSKMRALAMEVLNPHGAVALLTGASGRDSLPEGRKTISVIQGDAVPQRFIPEVRHAVNHIEGVRAVTEVRVRWSGHRLHAEVNVAVSPELSVEKGHEIAKEVRHQLLHHLRYLSNATIHIDPMTASGEEHRRMGEHAHGDLPAHSHL